MNHIYKVVFCKTTGTFVAVAEYARAHGKNSSGTVGSVSDTVTDVAKTGKYLMFSAISSAMLLMSGQAMAVDGNTTSTGTTGTANTNILPSANACYFDTSTKNVVCGDAGTKATVTGDIAIGLGSSATGYGSTYNTMSTSTTTPNVGNVTGENYGPALAQGSFAKAEGRSAIAIGNNAQALGSTGNNTINELIAIGASSKASGNRAVAVGYRAQTAGANTVALGAQAGNADQGIASGYVNAAGAVFIGQSAGNAVSNTNPYITNATDTTRTANTSGIAIGPNAGSNYIYGTEAVAIGNLSGTFNRGNTNYAIGSRAGQYVTGADDYAMGIEAGRFIEGSQNYAGGYATGNFVKGINNLNLGKGTRSGKSSAILGDNSTVDGQWVAGSDNIALGTNSGTYIGEMTGVYNATAENMVFTVATTASNNIAVGNQANNFTRSTALKTSNNIAMGLNSQATGGIKTAIASDKTSDGNSIAIGNQGTVLNQSGIAIGTNAVNINSAKGDIATYRTKETTLRTAEAAWNTQYNKNVQPSVDTLSDSQKKLAQFQYELSVLNAAATPNAVAIAAKQAEITAQQTTIASNQTTVNNALTGIQTYKTSYDTAKADFTSYYATVATGAEKGIAIGADSLAGGKNSIAMGTGAQALNEGSISIGTKNVVNGANAGALGDPSYINGAGTYTVGNNNGTSGNPITAGNSGAFGNGNMMTGTDTQTGSRIIGNNNYVTTDNTFVLGNGVGSNGIANGTSVVPTLTNSVYLGSNTTAVTGTGKNVTSTNATSTTTTGGATGTVSTATVGKITYSGFAGQSSKGAVTVGAADAERRISNVAAGQILDTSTDAINGSQLYFTNTAMDKIATSTATNLGGGSTVGTDGTISAPTYTVYTGTTTSNATGNSTIPFGATANNVGAGLNNLNTYVNQGFNIKDNGGTTQGVVTPTESVQFVNGTGTNSTVTTEANGVTKVQYDLNAATQTSLGKADTAMQNFTTSVGGTAVETINQTNKDINFVNGTGTTARASGSDITFDVKTDGVTTQVNSAGQVSVIIAPITSTGGVASVTAPANSSSLATAGDVVKAVNATGFNVTSAANGGTVKGSSNEFINSGETVKLQAGTGVNIAQAGNDFTFSVNAQSLSNSAQLPVVYTDAAGNKVYKVGNNFYNNGQGTGSTIDPATIIASMQNADGTTTTQTKLTNVAPATLSPTSTDAVNGSQLYATNQNVTNLTTFVNKGFEIAADNGSQDNVQLGQIITYTSSDKNIVTTVSDNKIDFKLADTIKVGSTNPVTINGTTGTIGGLTNKTFDPANIVSGQAATEDQLKAVSDSITTTNTGTVTKGLNFNTDSGTTIHKDLGAELKILGDGKNITTKTDNGNVVVSMTDTPTFTSVTTGNTVMNDSGVTINNTDPTKVVSLTNAGLNNGNNKIVNVAKGDINNNSTDAVNGSQLYAQGEGVKNIIGGNTTYDPATGTYTNNNIGGTGQNNINDAIQSINTTAVKAKTTVEAGTNINVDTGTNADGSTKYTVSTKPNLTADSISINGGTVKLDNTGLNNGGNVISNVGSGGTTVTNAANIGDVQGSRTTVKSSDNSISVINTAPAGSSNFAYDIKVNNQGITNGSQIPVVYTQTDGTKVYITGTDANNNPIFNTKADGSGTTVQAGNVITSMQNATGSTTSPTKLTNVAPATLSATSTDAVNGSQLYATNQQVANNTAAIGRGINFGGTTGSNNYQLGDTINVKGDSNITSTTVAGGAQLALAKDITVNSVTAGNTVLSTTGLNNGGNTITNVAAGVNLTDAVNVSQLNNVKSVIGVGDGQTTPKIEVYNVADRGTKDNVTVIDAINHMNNEGIQYFHTNGSDTNAVRTEGSTKDSSAEAARSTAIGVKASVAKDAKDSLAIGTGATANIANSVALGSNAVTTRSPDQLKAEVAYAPKGVNPAQMAGTGEDVAGEVSVGTAGATRRISNLAAGSLPTDAVNVSQLAALDDKLGHKLGDLEEKAYGGISSAMAMAALPQAYLPGKSMLAGGMATYNGEGAVAIGVSKLSDNGRWVIKVNGTADTSGNAGAAVGAGFHW